jgi:hypothetical protein
MSPSGEAGRPSLVAQLSTNFLECSELKQKAIVSLLLLVALVGLDKKAMAGH